MIRRLNDRKAIERVVCDPWVSARVSHDDWTACYIESDLVQYWGGYADGKLRAVFLECVESAVSRDMHVYALKRDAKYVRALTHAFIAKLFESPKTLRISTHIFGCTRFAESVGFVREGVKRDACVKGLEVRPVYIMGLTRRDWECRLPS